jgi:hypothetical protein
MKPSMAGWLVLLGCLWLSAAQASNVGFLKDAPYFAQFTDEDRKMLHETLANLLKLGKDQDTRTWENPKTGASGDLRLLPAAKTGGSCRDVEIRNTARGVTGKSVQRFCPDVKGVWQWKPQPQ